MLRAFLLVGFGGFFGSILRYAVSNALNRYAVHFPFGTFLVNIAGCFLIGLLFGLGQRNSWLQQDAWLILATGFCGGFTTFSSFALEQQTLISKGQYSMTALYAGISLVLGLLVCRAGVWLTAPRL